MAADKIRIGLLGAGAMGAEHALAYADIADAQVASVFSRGAEQARSVADLCGAKPLTDAGAVIADPTLDAIDVCLPSAIHHEVVIPALGYAKHVFCETPLALSLDHARSMREAARRAGRLLQVGLLMRSIAPYANVKATAVSGRHGRLLSLATYRLGSYLRKGAPDHKSHYSDPSTELMTFDFDFANWLLGAPARLSASAARLGDGTPGEVTALLSYDDGRQATIVASGLMPRSYPFSVGFRALFEGAVFELHNVFADGPPASRFTVFDDAGAPSDVETAGQNPYRAELQRFVDCIAGRAEPELLDVERAIEALRLSAATQRSLAEARSIAIHDVR